ncbi:MAG: hypothetical protein AB8C13_01480 [Phycisphaerales bacterium]
MNDRNVNQVDDAGNAVLSSKWVTLGLLVFTVIVLSRVMGVMQSPAYAEMAVTSTGYTMMTTNGGPDEILVLVDSREESILVYRTSQMDALELLERESLSGLFARARVQAMGRP